MEARRRVLEGRSANPMLGLIIEEGGEPPEPQRPPRVKALSAFVRNKVFKRRPPTAAQEEAIRIALNTPDIALIQGPPGTGKTTVIAAIVERLNELSDKDRIHPGRGARLGVPARRHREHDGAADGELHPRAEVRPSLRDVRS